MQYKILASDLDGTLFNNKAEVSPENWAAIEQMHKMGIHFVPASGRAFGEMPPQLRESPLIRYYISSDGSAVYDKHTGKSYDLALSREVGHAVLDKFYSYDVCIMLHADNVSYVEKSTHNAEHYGAYRMNQAWINFAQLCDQPVSNLKELAYSLPAIQSFCVFFKNMDELQECKAFFEKDDRILVAQTDPCNLEVFASHAGKGNALWLLADVLGVPREATIGVGDSTNDMTLVQSAGLGLAMENAVPELKAAADEIICSNQEHSAAYILKHYIEK